MVAAALPTGCGGKVRGPSRTRLTAKEIVVESRPAIVRIESAFTNDAGGVGTGFFIDDSGVVATNLHVIRGATAIKVTTYEGEEYAVSAIVGLDGDRDLALLKIDAKTPMKTLRLGKSSEVSPGDSVIAIGNPLGMLDYTVSDGLISSVRNLGPTLTVLQISAPISQGSSGGPLFNNYGEVIGVATAIFAEGQNLNFGVPIDYLEPIRQHPLRISVAAFAEQIRAEDAARGGVPLDGPKINRRVPRHQIEDFAGCSDQDITATLQAITEAIEVGAPLYNDGNHKACFMVYEAASTKAERESQCAPIRDAFGQGLLRVTTVESFTEKAWALRDTFDGLLIVFERRARGGN